MDLIKICLLILPFLFQQKQFGRFQLISIKITNISFLTNSIILYFIIFQATKLLILYSQSLILRINLFFLRIQLVNSEDQL